MLKKLSFKNWRSLRNVVIDDFTPITVLIGANSSGKTNILDALYFLRDCSEKGVLQAIQNRGGVEKVRSLGVDSHEPIEIGLTFTSQATVLTYQLGLKYETASVIPTIMEKLSDQAGTVYLKREYGGDPFIFHYWSQTLDPFNDAPLGWEQTLLSAFGNSPMIEEINETFQFITKRWQLLDENFMPPLSLQTGVSGDFMVIDRCADNVPIMLDFMKREEKKTFQQLKSDLQWLLGHIEAISVHHDEFETRFAIHEPLHSTKEAPTISAGTARLVAMLTAIYALDYEKRKERPGLLVFEEPDVAIHPRLLKQFVEQLRNYVSREYPRQFILTTHNPHILDYFDPEEVRIVQRDIDGNSSVERIPDSIREIWLDEYGLGQVWTTGALGGVPE